MIGIDICSISRFANMNNLDKFLNKYFTKKEIEYIVNTGNRYETIAGIFALKEAFVKAIGTGFGIFSPIDIEVIHNFSGKPELVIFNDIINKFDEIFCSVSHDGDFAIGIVDIKFSKSYIDTKITSEYKNIMPKRKYNAHKGDFGKIGIIGGSIGMCGSVDLCAKSALRMGSGLVYNICPKSISDILQIKALENIVIPINDDNRGYFISKYKYDIVDKVKNLDAISVGCGMGKNTDNIEILELIFKYFDKPIVIDADAIFFLKDIDNTIFNKKNIVITPHEYEFSKFSYYELSRIKKNRLDVLNEFFNQDLNYTLVLKGNNTIIKSMENCTINTTGNNGMATAGSGDCLTGVILSLLGQGLNTFDASKLGVFIHGLAGDFARDEVGEDSLIASDIIKFLPKSIKYIRR